MIQKIKQFLVVGVASSMLLLPGLAVPALGGAIASADNIQSNLCSGSNAASGSNCVSTGGGNVQSGLQGIATSVTKWFSIIVGAISVIMIIYGGFRYITSGGDSGKVGSAKNTIIYAIIGLIIVALAQLIVNLVLTQSNTAQGNFTSGS